MKKEIKNKILTGLGIFLITFSFNTAFADGPAIAPPSAPKSSVKLDNPIKANNIQDLLFSVVDILIFIGAIVAVFVFIWVGFQLIMAQGNESALKEAKGYFLSAVIGTAILISSKLIVVVIKNTLISSGVVDQSQFTQQK